LKLSKHTAAASLQLKSSEKTKNRLAAKEISDIPSLEEKDIPIL